MTWPVPFHIAHRGGAHVAPENTLAAAEACAERGYRAIEVDVGCNADGDVYLLHDARLERTTNGSGRLIDTPSSVLATLDAGSWFDARFAGTKVPTLAQALDAWERLNLIGCIELKANQGQDPVGLATKVATAVAERGAPHVLISFQDEALMAARAVAPGVPRALLLGDPWPDTWRERAQAVGAVAIDIDQRLATPERVAAMHAAGFAVVTWTVNEPERARELAAMGVDGITTDAIDRIRPT
jgi:glycerophosphoryl diester phosphodiesterase